MFSPLTLRLNSNTGLAPLLALAATGQHLNGATLVGVTAGLQDKVYQLDLADVLVTKVEDNAAAGLTLSLDYGKIELDTFTQRRHGRRSARGAVRLRSDDRHGRRHGTERASERERRSEPSLRPISC